MQTTLIRRLIAASALIPTTLLAIEAPAQAQTAGDPLATTQYGLTQSRFTEAWTRSTGSGVIIAIVDTGIDGTHPDLAGKLVAGKSFLTGDPSTSDPNGHGTHVAGIAAAATGNGIGIAGGAPDARLMPIRVLNSLGSGSDDTIAAGIRWAADNGARVINLSLGESGFASRLSKNGALNSAIRYASGRGAVVVAASGNEGKAKRVYRISAPVVVVGAVDASGAPAPFSNFGDNRAVTAAGVGILSTAPVQPTELFPNGTNGYAELDGTSMAAPLVAAEAALLLQIGLSADQVRDRIFQTAVNTTGDPRLGAGIVDATAALTGSTSQATATPSTPSAPNAPVRPRRRSA
jgi:serine protease